MKVFSCILFLLIFLYWMFPHCFESAWAQSVGSEPIHIEADRMESDNQQDIVVFLGHVVAKQGEVVIRADKMTVNYSTPQNDRSNEAYRPEDEMPSKRQAEPATKRSADNMTQRIKVIFAQGNVKIVKGDWVAVGNSMEYYATDRKVVLTGDAKAWQDKNMVTGDHIVLYLDEGKSIVERGGKEGKRVKAFIYPDGEAGSQN